jgi:nitrogen fixation protein NifU and related proteins
MQYSPKVLKHFRNPQNVGAIKSPDGVGEIGNVVCGDVMKLYITVEANAAGEDIIKDIKFETYGCAAAIATSSAITDLAIGKTIDYALGLNYNSIVKYLDGLPPIKIHCSLLSVDALVMAIYNYFQENKKPISAELEKRYQRILKKSGH